MKRFYIVLSVLFFLLSQDLIAQTDQKIIQEDIKTFLDQNPELKKKLDDYYSNQSESRPEFKEEFESGVINYEMIEKVISEDSFSFLEKIYWNIVNSDETNKVADIIVRQLNKAKSDLESEIKKIPPPKK